MKKLSVFVLLVILLCFSLLQCNLPKQFVGRKTGYNNPYFCSISNLPESCMLNLEHFTFVFTISEGNMSGEYVVEGKATYKGQGGFDTLVIGGKGSSTFYFLLANGGEIIDSFTFMLTGGSSHYKQCRRHRRGDRI